MDSGHQNACHNPGVVRPPHFQFFTSVFFLCHCFLIDLMLLTGKWKGFATEMGLIYTNNCIHIIHLGVSDMTQFFCLHLFIY